MRWNRGKHVIRDSLAKIDKLCKSKSKYASIRDTAQRVGKLCAGQSDDASDAPEVLAQLTKLFELLCMLRKEVKLQDVMLLCMANLLSLDVVRGDYLVDHGPEMVTSSLKSPRGEDTPNSNLLSSLHGSRSSTSTSTRPSTATTSIRSGEDSLDVGTLAPVSPQKIQDKGYVPGSNYIRGIMGERSVIRRWVDLVCNRLEPSSDEHRQSRIVSILLAAYTNPICEVHETTLQLVMRTIHNIYLTAKNSSTQTLAKAALLQIVQNCIQRFEVYGIMLPASDSPTTRYTGPSSMGFPFASSPFSRAAHPASSYADSTVASEGAPISTNGEDNVQSSVDQSSVEDSNSFVRGLVEAVFESVTLPSEERGNHMLNSIAGCVTAGGISIPQISLASPRLSQRSLNSTTCDTSPRARNLGAPGPPSVLENDCCMVFKALCKLSQKPLPEKAKPESADLRSKVLALELLLEILSHSGAAFRGSKSCTTTVKENLCISLLQNCVCPVAEILEPALSIFAILACNFKDTLKTEIGIIFTNVFLAILESHNASFVQKHLVIKTIHKLCQSPQLTLDTYLNYDCELDSQNIFESILGNLSKVIGTTQAEANWVTKAQEQQIKQTALEALVMIAKSMSDWMQRFIQDTPDNSLEAKSPEVENPELCEVPRPLSFSRSTPRAATEVFTPRGNEEESEFQKTRALKRTLRRAVQLFKEKAKLGVEYVREEGLIGDTAQDVAEWLLNTRGLDPVRIGEYLGTNKEFERDVMHAYLEQFDFDGLQIDEAMRLFLGKFKIQGEAQVIDRIMEKFAECYCEHNPNAFASADTAYVLAFSIMMLNTDAHSEAVEKKMTLPEFLKNNAKIDDGKDLPAEYLEGVYERITTVEIVLENPEDVELTAAVTEESKDLFASTTKKKKLEKYSSEVAKIVSRSRQLFEHSRQRITTFHVADRVEYVKPMFDMAWTPMLTAFSGFLENGEAPETINACLDGFQYCIHISCMFQMYGERDAFISSLSRLTLPHSIRELQAKTVESIQVLLSVAHKDGDYLQGSWHEVLKCISQLEKLQLLGSGVKTDYAFLHYNRNHHSPKPKSSRESEQSLILEDQHAKRILQSLSHGEADKIFSRSPDLSDEAIVFFVQCLCTVSHEEICSTPPRTFSLQKLIEIADDNMDRIRFVWTQIWTFMSKHFNTVGCHPTLSTAMFAIDSLKQLSLKFLEKQELTNYQFQRDFLKPFEYIMANNRALEVKDLILRCLTQMICARASNIKSGWKSIFGVFALAAVERQDPVITLGFEGVEQVVNHHFHLIADVFVDLVNCLISFASNEYVESISLRSIDHLQLCARHLIDGIPVPAGLTNCSLASDPLSPVTKKFIPVPKTSQKDTAEMMVLFPILTGLSAVASCHSSAEARRHALKTLFDILHYIGSKFSSVQFRQIFSGVLLPLFRDGLSDLESLEVVDETEQEWLISIMEVGLPLLTTLFARFHEKTSSLLPYIANLVGQCLIIPSSRVAQVGTDCLHRLLVGSHEVKRLRADPVRYEGEDWDRMCDKLLDMFKVTVPSPLIHAWLEPSTNTLHYAKADVEEVVKTAFRSRSTSLSLHIPPLPVPKATVKAVDLKAKKPQAGLTSKNQSPTSKHGSKEHSMGSPVSHMTSAFASYDKKRAPSLPAGTAIIRVEHVNIQLQAHLALIQLVEKIFNILVLNESVELQQMAFSHVEKCLGALLFSYEFVERWAAEGRHFTDLSASGHSSTIADLFEQERCALEVYIKALFRLKISASQYVPSPEKIDEPLQQIILKLVTRICKLNNEVRHVYVASDIARFKQELQGLNSAIVLVLNNCRDVSNDEFKSLANIIYFPLLDLVSDQTDARVFVALKEFLQRVGHLTLGFGDPGSP